MQNAPPKSLSATQGQGSRLWSMDIVECHERERDLGWCLDFAMCLRGQPTDAGTTGCRSKSDTKHMTESYLVPDPFD